MNSTSAGHGRYYGVIAFAHSEKMSDSNILHSLDEETRKALRFKEVRTAEPSFAAIAVCCARPETESCKRNPDHVHQPKGYGYR